MNACDQRGKFVGRYGVLTDVGGDDFGRQGNEVGFGLVCHVVPTSESEKGRVGPPPAMVETR